MSKSVDDVIREKLEEEVKSHTVNKNYIQAQVKNLEKQKAELEKEVTELNGRKKNLSDEIKEKYAEALRLIEGDRDANTKMSADIAVARNELKRDQNLMKEERGRLIQQGSELAAIKSEYQNKLNKISRLLEEIR